MRSRNRERVLAGRTGNLEERGKDGSVWRAACNEKTAAVFAAETSGRVKSGALVPAGRASHIFRTSEQTIEPLHGSATSIILDDAAGFEDFPSQASDRNLRDAIDCDPLTSGGKSGID